MAERSFAREVRDLELGEGQEFRGEGILALTKALLQSGVGYVGGYQGAPISHLMDVLSDAQELLGKLGVQFSASASEAAAAASLSASMMYPIRGAVTFKSTVGTNVASDALANLASSGVTGGALIIVGEDYGEGSSIMQERSHAFAMKSQIWLLDPRPDLPSIVKSVEDGFQLSEASNTPVMLELRIRSCHVHGSFIARDNKRPPYTLAQALESPVRDVNKIVLPPASYVQEKEKIEKRWPAAVQFIKERKLNEVFDGDLSDVGIALQGGMYNGVMRALQRLGLADIWGKTRVPLYVMNVTYPLIDDELAAFCASKRAVLIVEEGQPDFIEQTVNTILRRRDINTRLYGKDVLPMAGEYTPDVMPKGVRAFMTTADLNIGRSVGEPLEAVMANRARVNEALGAQAVFMPQVHGAEVLRLEPAHAVPLADMPKADAAVSTTPGLAVAIQVADCLPVLFAAPGGVAGAHAGWRGLAAGVLENTVAALCEAVHCRPAEVHAWMGACIGPEAFEVGADVLEAFGAAPQSQAVRHFRYQPNAEGEPRWRADLPGLARERLGALGLAGIGGGHWCTFSDPRFFSYRRERLGGPRGRMVAAISLL